MPITDLVRILSTVTLCCISAGLTFAATPVRRYYSASDTIVSVTPHSSRYVVEARAALPRAKDGAGLSSDWWGLTTDDGQTVTLHGFTQDYGTVHERRGLRVKYQSLDSLGQVVTTDSADIWSGINLGRGFNTVALEWSTPTQAASSPRLDIFVGDATPECRLSINAPLPTSTVKLIGKGERRVETLLTEQTPDMTHRLASGISLDDLASIIASTTDSIEGYYDYFDRATDDNRARLGGKYRFAIIRTSTLPSRLSTANSDHLLSTIAATPSAPTHTGESYAVLYISGATTGAPLWRPAMIKGLLTPARFEGIWNLTWLDAVGDLLDDDESYATFTSTDGILTLHFPYYHSQLRFAKQ